LMWKYWMKIDLLPEEAFRLDEFKFFSKRDGHEILN
jgi:hypothetical protein